MQARRFAAEFERGSTCTQLAGNFSLCLCSDNPMIFIDPDGRDVWEINRDEHMVRRIEDDT
jgi:hypothetical protein